MKSISEIKTEIGKLKQLAKIHQEKLDANPDNTSSKLSLNSLNKRIEDLHSQLVDENNDRYKEIIELRFRGKKAEYGSMPLYTIGALTDSFYNALFNTSKYVQYGHRNVKNGGKIIRETIDLRLEDIGKGSTIFYISGRISPDLFGNSIIQSSLDKTLGFLNSSENDVMSNISSVGSGSIKYLSRLFKELQDDDLELDIKWETPENSTIVWEGSKEKIHALSNTLSKIQVLGTEKQKITGEIESLHVKGKMDIKDNDGNKYLISFPLDLKEEVKTLHVGDFVTIETQKTTISNQAIGKQRYEYSLINIVAST